MMRCRKERRRRGASNKKYDGGTAAQGAAFEMTVAEPGAEQDAATLTRAKSMTIPPLVEVSRGVKRSTAQVSKWVTFVCSVLGCSVLYPCDMGVVPAAHWSDPLPHHHGHDKSPWTDVLSDWYHAPQQRHQWGEAQYELHAGGKELFLDLIFVGVAFEVGVTLKNSFFICDDGASVSSSGSASGGSASGSTSGSASASDSNSSGSSGSLSGSAGRRLNSQNDVVSDERIEVTPSTDSERRQLGGAEPLLECRSIWLGILYSVSVMAPPLHQPATRRFTLPCTCYALFADNPPPLPPSTHLPALAQLAPFQSMYLLWVVETAYRAKYLTNSKLHSCLDLIGNVLLVLAGSNIQETLQTRSDSASALSMVIIFVLVDYFVWIIRLAEVAFVCDRESARRESSADLIALLQGFVCFCIAFTLSVWPFNDVGRAENAHDIACALLWSGNIFVVWKRLLRPLGYLYAPSKAMPIERSMVPLNYVFTYHRANEFMFLMLGETVLQLVSHFVPSSTGSSRSRESAV